MSNNSGSLKKRLGSRKSKEAITAYLMLLPDMLGLLVFVFIPIVYAFYVSLHKWNGLTDMQFIGLNNYAKLFGDKKFSSSIWITIQYTLMYVPAVFILSLLLANLLNSLNAKAQSFFRTAYFMPYAISTVIAALMWSFIYDPMRGYLNAILSNFGIESQKFLASTSQALPSVAVVGVWLVLGYNTIIFLSAIKDIPKSYYEAADIDGASATSKFYRITVPLLKDTSMFILVVTIIGSFQAFDQIKVMTNGGPAGATTTSVYFIYQQAFEISKMGYSSAAAFLLFIAIMVLTLFQLKLFNKNDSYN